MHNIKTLTPASCDFLAVINSALTNGVIAELSYLVPVKITGRDAEEFLHGQMSNDIKAIEVGHAQLNAYCNPKGRTLAIVRILHIQEGEYWMIAPESVAESIVKRLKIFVMRSKVALEITEKMKIIGLIGHDSDGTLTENSFTYDGSIPRKLIIGDAEQIQSIANSKDVVLHRDFWRLADIMSGIPQVYTQTAEAFIPQHINLEMVNGISFKKGCFAGQEIIARLKYLGKSKYRLCLANLTSSEDIHPGDALFSPDRPQQKSGVVIDAVRTAPTQFTLSAMLSITRGEHPRAFLGSIDGSELSLSPLPYQIPAE